MATTLEDVLKASGKCCITGKPLSDCKKVRLVPLKKKANWTYPVWGNIMTGEEHMAYSVVHETAYKDGKLIGEVQYAIELHGPSEKKDIIYHPVTDL